ncbi:acyl carrier protein [Streptomyces virginiae]
MTAPTDPAEITRWLTGHLAGLLEVSAANIDPTAPLDALGITSMEEVMITAELEARYAVTVPVADMRRHPTVAALAGYIVRRAAEVTPDVDATAGSAEPSRDIDLPEATTAPRDRITSG